ncbi:MAG: hypothetical protein AB1679_06030 [Actinomycetota bacterium]
MDADADVRDVTEIEDLVVIDDGPEILATTTEVASPPAWQAARPRDGIPLHRFLERAKLSLAEAASLGSLFLETVAVMHESGCGHGRIDSRSVRIVSDGTVRLAEWGPDTEFPVGLTDEVRGADIGAAAAIAEEIKKCAGRPARPLTDREDRLLARLTSAADADSLRRRGLRRAARGLELAVGRTEQRDAARQGVVGLIRAVAGVDAAASEAASARARSIGARPPSPPARRLPPPARRPPLWPRIREPLAIVTAALVVLGVEIHLFGDDVKRNVDTLLNGDATADAAGPRRPAPVPDLGPPAAGPITHLELRPLDGCRPEAVCNAVLQVAAAPHDVPLDVHWRFELLDRCGAFREERPGGVLTVPPGHDRAVQTVSVAVPAGQALTLVPLSTAPALVAGTPMPLFPPDRTC